MVFSSLVFLYLFLPGTLILYAAAPKRAKNAVLLLASVAFYFCGEQLKVLLMLGEIALAYVSGRLMERLPARGRKAVLTGFLVLSLGLLVWFKCTVLPIGISFYTFQCVSYVIDVYRGSCPAEKRPLSFALYVSFFPQLIAGPIVRYDAVSRALEEREFTFARFGDGAFRFVLGLGKKVLLADLLYAFAEAGGSGILLTWLQSLAYVFYVYFDFSGYSDMAIGLAKAFGFDIPENFRYPLISRSFREFWRRWHISLGSWFRDYLYIPLGGNRKGLPRQIRNLLIVWLLTGLWHGMSWNFAAWGLASGLLIVLETLWERYLRPAAAVSEKPSRRSWLRVPPVLLITALLFVLFRFPDPGDAAAWFRQMFSGSFLTAEGIYYIKGAAILLTAAAFGATPLPKRAAVRAAETSAGQKLKPFAQALLMLAVLLLVTASLVDGSFSPFLYFRF